MSLLELVQVDNSQTIRRRNVAAATSASENEHKVVERTF
jgi:hypothetical protein